MPQFQYYEQDWNNHHYSSQSQWGFNSPESYCQPPYQHPASYTPPEQPLEESIDWEKRMEVLDELERQIQILEDSKSHQNFQITDPYSMFQEEHTDLEKSIEFTIQFQNDLLDIIETRLSRLENMHRNKETLRIKSLTILNTSSHTDENQESWYLEDFDQDSISSLTKIQFHHKTLNLTNINPLTN